MGNCCTCNTLLHTVGVFKQHSVIPESSNYVKVCTLSDMKHSSYARGFMAFKTCCCVCDTQDGI